MIPWENHGRIRIQLCRRYECEAAKSVGDIASVGGSPPGSSVNELLNIDHPYRGFTTKLHNICYLHCEDCFGNLQCHESSKPPIKRDSTMTVINARDSFYQRSQGHIEPQPITDHELLRRSYLSHFLLELAASWHGPQQLCTSHSLPFDPDRPNRCQSMPCSPNIATEHIDR